MQVDTGEFRALTEEIGALGRKVSTLTGRVTVMGKHVNRLDDMVDDDMGMLIRLCADLCRRAPGNGDRPGRHAAPGKERHLRLVAEKT
jgi:hypothetical protein